MRALITGADGEIGCALVHYLLKNKYDVIALDKNIQHLQMIANENPRLSFCQIDFLDQQAVENILGCMNQPFDVLIYAAGIREIVPMMHLSLSQWRAVMDVNLTGAFLASQCAAKLAIEHDLPLSIIYVASISGMQGEPMRSAYCASKHGMLGLTKTLAIELAEYQIRVNAIAPGLIETSLTRPYLDNPETMDQLNKNIPLRQWGKPDHIVQAVDFLIHNDYATGSTLVVDGGWTAGKTL